MPKPSGLPDCFILFLLLFLLCRNFSFWPESAAFVSFCFRLISHFFCSQPISDTNVRFPRLWNGDNYNTRPSTNENTFYRAFSGKPSLQGRCRYASKTASVAWRPFRFNGFAIGAKAGSTLTNTHPLTHSLSLSIVLSIPVKQS